MRIITRHKIGRGFGYRFDNGEAVDDKEVIAWCKSLAIPPAWREVVVNTDKRAKILVTGRDDKGRKQYIYNPQHIEAAQQDKFDRIVRFAQQLETMRRKTERHLNFKQITKRTVLAGMTRLLDEAYFRPGNASYTRNNGTYGLTTLRSKHVTFENGNAVFHYVGKSGQQQERKIEDTKLNRLLRTLDDMPGYELFSFIDEGGNRSMINADELNGYIASVMGEDFSAKDFRTWAGTFVMATTLNEFGPPDDDKSAKSNITEAYKVVAEELGNTPAITRESYVHPAVVSAYEAGFTLDAYLSSSKDSKYQSALEDATIALIESID